MCMTKRKDFRDIVCLIHEGRLVAAIREPEQLQEFLTEHADKSLTQFPVTLEAFSSALHSAKWQWSWETVQKEAEKLFSTLNFNDSLYGERITWECEEKDKEEYADEDSLEEEWEREPSFFDPIRYKRRVLWNQLNEDFCVWPSSDIRLPVREMFILARKSRKAWKNGRKLSELKSVGYFPHPTFLCHVETGSENGEDDRFVRPGVSILEKYQKGGEREYIVKKIYDADQYEIDYHQKSIWIVVIDPCDGKANDLFTNLGAEKRGYVELNNVNTGEVISHCRAIMWDETQDFFDPISIDEKNFRERLWGTENEYQISELNVEFERKRKIYDQVLTSAYKNSIAMISNSREQYRFYQSLALDLWYWPPKRQDSSEYSEEAEGISMRAWAKKSGKTEKEIKERLTAPRSLLRALKLVVDEKFIDGWWYPRFRGGRVDYT